MSSCLVSQFYCWHPRTKKSENGVVEATDLGLIINGKTTAYYEFKENYYFVMRHNRHNSLDSRYCGLLPESLVIGKALYLYWSEILRGSV